MKSTGAVLTAAGLSSRMGEFKPMLPFGTSTISFHLVSLLKKMGINPVVVVTGYQAEMLEAHLASTGAKFVRNERYRETQMLDSVKIGIREVLKLKECERIMILPVDVPAICPETISQILMTDTDMVRTMYHGEPGHPILLNRDSAEFICVYDGEGGLRGAVEHSGISILNMEVEDEWICRDVDTKEEYLALIAEKILIA